ncbi:MAG: BlaI/MecI/CopY family transcriptional regulator [Oscillospiraceae bacterium]|nr:BlaI/MecI/CopY family transcriptional regulator [Oscillospiraceae bacterium]
MDKKLQDSEIKVMNVIWREGEVTAKRVAEILGAETGWNVNTTYTLIKRCIEKGAVERIEPNFTCRAIVKKEDVQRAEAETLLDKLFDGSADKLFAALLGSERLSPEEIAKLRSMIDGTE